jgi:sulfate-transporting ATPase
VLLAPLTGISVAAMPLLVIPVLAAVLIGEFESFWWTLAASMFIGIAQSEIGQYVHVTGASAAFPFLVIILYLMVRGEAASIRTATAKRLSAIGSGVASPLVIAVASIVGVLLLALIHDPNVIAALTVTFGWAIIVLSVVLLVGYAGQLSLLQFAIGGVAASPSGPPPSPP